MRNHDFSHILWIGGSVCSGKTSAAKDLASRYGLRIYSFDGAEPFHIYRSVPERQPNLIRFMAMTMDERWVLRAPEAMAEHALAAWSEERFPMVLDDLRRLPGSGAVIAEGRRASSGESRSTADRQSVRAVARGHARVHSSGPLGAQRRCQPGNQRSEASIREPGRSRRPDDRTHSTRR